MKENTADTHSRGAHGAINPTHHLYRSIAQLTSLSCDKPIAVICFADDNYIHIKSSCNDIDLSEDTKLDHSFCVHTIGQNEIFEVLDTTTDDRFKNLDSVKQFSHFRYYAGAPIVFNGKNVGTICVLDVKPNKLTQKQRARLESIQHILTETLQIQSETNQQIQPLYRANRLSILNLDSSALIHELSQPLTALNQYTTSISTFIGDDLSGNPTIKEQFNRTQNQIKRINNIILNQKKFLNGNHENNVAAINVKSLLDETLNLVNIELLDKDIIVMRQDYEDIPVVYCDQLQIQQVILNLILNSIRELNKQDTQRKIVISTNLEDNDYISISVQDNGSGLDSNLFKSLTTLHKLENTEGMGLGLILCKHIMMNHSGDLIHCPTKSGTHLKIILPTL